jgi:hypothetical protein
VKKLVLLCAAVMWLAVAGCGIITHTPAGQSDEPLEAKLSELKKSGGTAPLRDLTDFGWDEVHLFNEETPRDEIEAVVGDPVIRGGDSGPSMSLLVFEEGGKVVDSVTVTGDYLRADQSTFGSDVVVEPWGAGFMRLTEPGS